MQVLTSFFISPASSLRALTVRPTSYFWTLSAEKFLFIFRFLRQGLIQPRVVLYPDLPAFPWG